MRPKPPDHVACSNFPGPDLFLAPNDAAGNRIVASLWGRHTGHGRGAGDWCLATLTTCLLSSQCPWLGRRAPGWPHVHGMVLCLVPADWAHHGARRRPGTREGCVQAERTAHPVCAICHRGLPSRLLPEDPSPITTGQPPRASPGPHRGGVCGPEGPGNHSPTPRLPGDMAAGEALCLSGSQFSHL